MKPQRLVWVTVALLLVIPWINPFAPGPSPNVLPWLTSLATVAGLLAVVSFSLFPRNPEDAFAISWGSAAAAAWLISAAVSSLIGLLQYFGLTGPFEPWMNHARYAEAFANLRQRNQFATLTSIGLASLLWLAINVEFLKMAGRKIIWAMLPMAALLAMGSAASTSRTGLVQLFLLSVLCGVWGLWKQPLVRKVMICAILSYVLATLLLPYFAGFGWFQSGMTARLLDGDFPCASRLALWSNVLQLIAQKPWLGWGWGQLDYAHYITLYEQPRFCEILDNAHNLPLHLAIELGIPAAVFLCGGFTYWVYRQKPWRESDSVRQLAWSVMAVILLHSMFEYPLWYGPFQIAFGVSVLLLVRTKPTETSTAHYGNRLLSPRSATTVATAVLAILLFACVWVIAGEYRRVSQIYLPVEARDAAYRSDTLAKIRDAKIFRNQAQFAELLLTPLSRENALWTFTAASGLLHYSPEPRVVERVIESAVMLERNEDALRHLARYKAAFPKEYAAWTKVNAGILEKLPTSK